MSFVSCAYRFIFCKSIREKKQLGTTKFNALVFNVYFENFGRHLKKTNEIFDIF